MYPVWLPLTFWDWDLNPGLCGYKAGALLFEPHSVPFALVILEMGSCELFVQADLES
jgi:hypothetical protein